ERRYLLPRHRGMWLHRVDKAGLWKQHRQVIAPAEWILAGKLLGRPGPPPNLLAVAPQLGRGRVLGHPDRLQDGHRVSVSDLVDRGSADNRKGVIPHHPLHLSRVFRVGKLWQQLRKPTVRGLAKRHHRRCRGRGRLFGCTLCLTRLDRISALPFQGGSPVPQRAGGLDGLDVLHAAKSHVSGLALQRVAIDPRPGATRAHGEIEPAGTLDRPEPRPQALHVERIPHLPAAVVLSSHLTLPWVRRIQDTPYLGLAETLAPFPRSLP